MTKTPAEMTHQDLQELLEVGYSDKEIVGIDHVAVYFNHMDRVANALGAYRILAASCLSLPQHPIACS